MRLKKVKGKKPLDQILNHILERVDSLEQNQVELIKQIATLDGEIAVITDTVFEPSTGGDYDA